VEAIYNISLILLVLILIFLPVLLIILLIKPHLLNNRSFIKKPFSRGKIISVTVLIFLVSFFGFGGVMAATEPEYVKRERAARQLAEEKAKQDVEAQRRKVAEEARLREEEARKPVTKQETKVEAVSFETTERRDGTLPKGEKRVANVGVDGERTITYDVTYQEGKEISRKEVKSEITKQPTTKIVKVGTYVAPAPAPTPQPAPKQRLAPSSVYYKNCSAARAAGAAPVYEGQPGYGRHLDRDNDGVGCE